MAPHRRLVALDGLRGLAALSVVICHVLNVSPVLWAAASAGTPAPDLDPVTRIITYSPIHLVWAGGEAVLLFFLLSGYVLALPFLNGSLIPYSDFVIRRFCRIYVPYAAIVLLAAWLLTRFSGFGDHALSQWFNDQWHRRLTDYDLRAMGLMLGGESSTNLDGSTWSLVHEMRISLLFPVIVLAASRLSWRVALAVAVWVILIANIALPTLPFDVNLTVRYAPLFLVGATLARYQNRIGDFMSRLSTPGRLLLLVIALLLYCSRWLVPVPAVDQDLIIAIGGSLLLICALHVASVRGLLSRAPIRWLGKVSYSLYLVHIPVLLTLVYTLRDLVPIWAILAITLVVALCAAELLQRLVEAPAIKLGRYLSHRSPIHSTAQPVTSVA